MDTNQTTGRLGEKPLCVPLLLLQLVFSEDNADAMVGGDVTGHFAFDAQKNTSGHQLSWFVDLTRRSIFSLGSTSTYTMRAGA